VSIFAITAPAASNSLSAIACHAGPLNQSAVRSVDLDRDHVGPGLQRALRDRHGT